MVEKAKRILKDYGWCRICKVGADYFMCVDEGQAVVKMKSYRITHLQAAEAINNELDAEKIAFKIQ